MSTSNNSPQNFLGGTWVRIEGRFLLGAGSGYTAGDTGGEATHKLTTNEMPQHSHSFSYMAYTNSGTGTIVALVDHDGYPIKASSANRNGVQSRHNVNYADIGNTGGYDAHNNMPPYLVVYIWKRTA